jgi:hypothetical protein
VSCGSEMLVGSPTHEVRLVGDVEDLGSLPGRTNAIVSWVGGLMWCLLDGHAMIVVTYLWLGFEAVPGGGEQLAVVVGEVG